MSLSTAFAVDSLPPDELFVKSEKDLAELLPFWDSKNSGSLDVESFEALVSDVLTRMSTELPSLLIRRYCERYPDVPRSIFDGVDMSVAGRLAAVVANKTELAAKMFKRLDVENQGRITPLQLTRLHALFDESVLADIITFAQQQMIQRQLERLDAQW